MFVAHISFKLFLRLVLLIRDQSKKMQFRESMPGLIELKPFSFRKFQVVFLLKEIEAVFIYKKLEVVFNLPKI